jgi:hydroxymethylpyrimidine/phosphomethylpyrimidine kinase
MLRLLTIAGSDSGGGAGIQADLKTFAAHGAYGMSAIAAVTAQNTLAVSAVHELPAEVVAAQIDAVFGDLGVDAVKIGMLANAGIVAAVAAALARHGAGRAGAVGAGAGEDAVSGRAVPVVLDPVMVAKSGDSLLADDAVAALVADLLPLATVVTPNLPEARRLAGRAADGPGDEAEQESLARHVGAGGVAVLVKGGHAASEEVVDVLFDGVDVHRFRGPRLAGRSTHGTGCTLSSALAVRLAAGEPLPRAVEGAIAYLRLAIENAPGLGAGHGPLDHGVRPPPLPAPAARRGGVAPAAGAAATGAETTDATPTGAAPTDASPADPTGRPAR